jgi:hypothetical protein
LEPVLPGEFPLAFMLASASCTIGTDAAIADVSKIALINRIDVIFIVIV